MAAQIPSFPSQTSSSICCRFRHAVIGSPELWTKVELDATSENSTNLSQIYLERSAAREIWVTLRAPGRSTEILTGGLPLLTLYDIRISRVTVAADDINDLDQMLGPFRNVAVPRLQHFEVVTRPNNFDDPYRLPDDLFSLGAAKIYSLSMSYCFTGAQPRPWMNSITHVQFKNAASLGNGRSQIFTEITNQLTSLTHLSLDLSGISAAAGTGISSRCLTHIQLHHCGDDDRALLDVLSCFDTPALSDLTLYDCHGDQISVLFNSQLSFPELKSLLFINKRPETVQCKGDPSICEDYQTIASPLHTFPLLSSWSLINQCFTARMLAETLGRNSRPWPLLRTITVWPLGLDVDDVYDALRGIVQWKRENQEAVAKLRLSQSLFSAECWAWSRCGTG
ncbi:hypothetical protein FB45DRAFT_1059126 [Roridomyces roridus]|uniref:Uncharacterized protein n=1 Tax=Roridomyces roridus TaxID=1738132 RepID=A0AAD7BQR3_9AGAR|nr:hypothetical protein FB45DRAFT_1059126 [Roridomyces roridus]